MPIALTNRRIIYRQFEAPDRFTMVEAVNATLQAVGWASTAVTGGYKLQGTSPQGMEIFLYVRDKGHNGGSGPQVTYNFQTIDGTIDGMDHELQVGYGVTHQIVCGMCQAFVSVAGLAYNAEGGHFCGGIPFIPGASACGSEVPADTPPSQSFWAMGDGNNDIGPRGSLILNHTMAQSEALWGTDYCAPGNVTGSVRFPTLTPASSIGSGLNLPSSVLWKNGDDFVIEPMLAWGLASDVLAKIRAEAYDSMLFSKPRAMDLRHSRSVDGDVYNFVNFTDNWTYGGISLIVPTSSFIEGNYAFIST